MKGFANGINLGGWLSQYKEYDHHHFRTFITERDIAQIASWGMDHVRLPVDYPVIESDAIIGVPLESGYEYIDACLDWCAKHGLSVVLDIHEAPGFTFTNDLEEDTKDRNNLFESVAVQDRFVALWETILRRYKDHQVPIIFELLNEVTLPTNDKWNALVERTVPALRTISADATIMIGGTHNNGISGLEGLVVFDDPNVVYTFHSYDPLLFTHQNAHWAVVPRTWGEQPAYPGPLPRLKEFLTKNPQWADEYRDLVGREMNRDLLVEIFAPAIAFADRTGRELYCGEFGVADWVEPASRQRWLADFMGLLRENHVGRALWTYKQMDFGVVDADGNVIDEDYLAIIKGAV
jgi:endoglucanase